MPKKRNNIKSFKPVSTASPTASTSTNSSDRPSRSVNELLANLRRTSISPSSTSQSALPAAAPSVPPAIREILQIPDTPAPAPRRLARQRFDGNGRRLPAGPPPPRSWVARNSSDAAHEASSMSQSRLKTRGLEDTCLPGTYLPERGSLIDIVLQKLAYEWAFHRVYNQYHLYFVPNHLKAALIRYVGIASEAGLSLSDLKLILLPPPDTFDETELDSLTASNPERRSTYDRTTGILGRFREYSKPSPNFAAQPHPPFTRLASRTCLVRIMEAVAFPVSQAYHAHAFESGLLARTMLNTEVSPGHRIEPARSLYLWWDEPLFTFT
ncbi:hypothetical protein HZS61_012759 [Fusarium oxysporum f. sp. conglutinans]|uniref:Uncharacterized protein n=1 Tax=Fusarium oxysporum f. sp. conglutinans TaxID=100902 RepID=A0A8H6GVG0_FUSOX|nr:hypothetical protein HZS61_012759 [Fusarium oxysporum f. sp. conglutinans]